MNKTYKTDILIEKIDFSFLGNVDLKGVEIKDHKKDSLIYAKSIITSVFNVDDILNNKLELGEATIEGLIFNMTTHKGEEDDNLSIFIERFDDGKPSTGEPFLMTSSKMELKNAIFTLKDRNDDDETIVFYKNINGEVQDFQIKGPNVNANIRNLSFIDNHGIEVTDLTSNFTYTKQQMNFKNSVIKTENSIINGDVVFNYKREDLADFNNKVNIVGDIKESTISLKDINKFYNEFGENIKVNFTTKIEGVLNDFKLIDFTSISNRKSVIDGDLHFKNAVNREKGFSLDARIYEMSSNYQNLKRMLPNILGKTLPSAFGKLGNFSLAGKSYITEEIIEANIMIKSALGRTISDLKLTNIDDIDNAKYNGSIEFVDFNIGKVVNDSIVGNLSLVADVDGKGFTLEKLNTNIQGNISKLRYKGYTYNDLNVNGVFKNQLFNGTLITNDDNFKIIFKGLADLSSSEYKFDFETNIFHADLNKLNLFKRDEKSILKGDIDINLTGNSIDNIAGDISFKNTLYTNQNDNYYFKDFNVTSTFKDTVRVLTVNSSDIVEGSVKGRFKFNQLGKLAKNSLGSIYTNYELDKVASGQFLDFNFKIYDKIVSVFFPEVRLGSNTIVKGAINSDDEKFELLVKSPKIDAYNTIVEKIKLQIDNKNPLYNTLLSVDNVKTKYYDVADVNLVNVTLNDTLFFRTDFVGGKQKKEKFDLSFFHTINENNKSVVGLKKSSVNFKDNEWFINPTENKQNKVVIDKGFKLFAVDKINATSNNQKIDIAGIVNGFNDKDLTLNLENVLLSGITPEIDSLALNGLVNGKVHFKQVNGDYLPVANLAVDKLKINKIDQGDLRIEANGRNSLKKFDVVASLQNENVKSIDIKGEIDFEPKTPTIFANYELKDYDIRAFNPLGEGVLDKIRGEVSGKGVITGELKNPDINGDMLLKNGGLAIPYLNVNYDFIGESRLKLTNQTLRFLPTTLLDVAHDTEGILEGTISHTSFDNWYLDLGINTERLLILDTEESEEEPYYGTGFIAGNATIKGFTDALTIEVFGTTATGTEFIIPLRDVSTIGDNNLVKFASKSKKDKIDEQIANIVDSFKGLALNFNLTVTEDARAEIVIDKTTGSVLSGRGVGNIAIEIDTNGKFVMNGMFIVSNGIYQFRNFVADKDFEVQPGGSVIWTGNPFDAYLNNITSIYKTKANPNVLLGSGSTSGDVDINLIAKITGQLFNSDIEFDIEMPNVSSIAKSELDFKLNNQDKKMTQFLSLLTYGDFTNLDEGGVGFDAGAFGGTLVSQKAVNIVNGLLKSRGEKFDIGLSYDVGSKNNINQSLNTADQLGVNMSTKLGENIIVNGKASVPVGGNTQSRVVGEVEIELPLNEAKTFRAKAYNKQNEVQFAAADEEGYTQGLGLSYRVDFDNTRELVEKVFGKRKKTKKKIQKNKSELVNFVSKQKDTLKTNQVQKDTIKVKQ